MLSYSIIVAKLTFWACHDAPVMQGTRYILKILHNRTSQHDALVLQEQPAHQQMPGAVPGIHGGVIAATAALSRTVAAIFNNAPGGSCQMHLSIAPVHCGVR